VSFLEKDNKIKYLEELVLRIGYDLSNIKETEDLVKKSNDDIVGQVYV
jgi:hypothetical protein